MTASNLDTWLKVCRPPEGALKKINGGRLSGMTDISPMWRYKVMTEVYGPIGIGWYYELVNHSIVKSEDAGQQSALFAEIRMYVKVDGQWSAPISGTGGSMLVAKEKSGLHMSDEALKMAVTDALSVAMKQLGVGADIYMGMFDGSKYTKNVGGLSDDEIYQELVMEHAASIAAIKTGIANGDLSTAAEAWFTIHPDDDTRKEIMTQLWKAPSNGGCFTTQEREIIKSAEFRQAYYG